MKKTILLGRGQEILELPATMWKEHLTQLPASTQSRLSWMTEAHHRVRYFVVKELALQQHPIPPEFISETLTIPLADVAGILDELEQKLFFLVRNGAGAVSWAYPFTVEPTPHRLTFSSGERLYGAWAEDALAAPFVQGRLLKEPVSVEIDTKCSHCEREMHFTIDSAMRVSVRETQAKPLVFMPDVDWNHFTEPNIIHAYWRNSIFFWSEEHAREFRRSGQQVNGVYLTLEQGAYMTPITQGALFAFE